MGAVIGGLAGSTRPQSDRLLSLCHCQGALVPRPKMHFGFAIAKEAGRRDGKATILEKGEKKKEQKLRD